MNRLSKHFQSRCQKAIGWASSFHTWLFAYFLLGAITVELHTQEKNIKLQPGELYIEYTPKDAGFHLWVENKPELGSIMITDHTNDPEKKQHVYALRASTYNPYNGNEKRLLEGKFLPQELYSLIDSTPESNPYFPHGAFHIFIPFTVVYGYPWSRNGSKTIGRDSWINIRTFSKAYGDYSGSFEDNPFMLSLSALPEQENAKEPPPAVVSVLNNLDQKINDLSRNTIDVALVLDTTISMRDNVEFLRSKLIPMVKQQVAKFDSFRIGIVLYRDYGEEYLVKPFDFSNNLDTVQTILDGIRLRGGGDKPEAVYEGIYSALTDLKWLSNKRLVIQVGDAPPHAKPKGKVTQTMILAKSQEMLVQLQQINLSDVESEHNKQSLAEDRAKLASNTTTNERL